MVIAEESSSAAANEAAEIDLKCAEKVTDSDAEEQVDVDDSQQSRSQYNPTTDGADSSANNASSDPNRARDFTCKPKAIKAHRQTVDSAILNYQQIPMYAFNSPKNPTGILPFQPTGNLIIDK